MSKQIYQAGQIVFYPILINHYLILFFKAIKKPHCFLQSFSTSPIQSDGDVRIFLSFLNFLFLLNEILKISGYAQLFCSTLILNSVCLGWTFHNLFKLPVKKRNTFKTRVIADFADLFISMDK